MLFHTDQDSTGLHAVLLQNRAALLRFLRLRGAGEDAEDLLQELWLKVAQARPGPLAKPLSYLYHAANNLMVDRHRSARQAGARDREWHDAVAGPAGASEEPGADRLVIGRQILAGAEAALAALGPRVERAFRRHRLDGVPQREVAAELGVSLSTIESDLRRAARTLIEFHDALDQGREGMNPSRG